jgi:hypothetical protein
MGLWGGIKKSFHLVDEFIRVLSKLSVYPPHKPHNIYLNSTTIPTDFINVISYIPCPLLIIDR